MPWELLLVACLLYVGLGGFLYAFQARLVYLPARTLMGTPKDLGLRYEEVTLGTEDGYQLHGWYVPTGEPHPTLLFFHGNAGNISHRLESLRLFHQLGLNTFIFDYRGYGQSQGSPSERGTYLDATAAWRYLTEHRQIPPHRIVLFGRSLGSAVAIWLASRTAPSALVIESAFTSLPDLAAKIYPFLPVRWLSRIRYDNHRLIRQVRCPILVIHSPTDEVVPFAHGRALFDLANDPKQFLTIRGGHNDGFLVSQDVYLRGIDEFLESVYRASTPASAPLAHPSTSRTTPHSIPVLD